MAGREPDHEVQPGQHRLGVPGGVVDGGAAELLHQQVHQPQPDPGGVAVARQVDQGGEVAAVLVLAQEEPELAPLLQVEDVQRDREQLVGGGLEELVAGVGLQDLDQVAGVVALGGEAGLGDGLGDLAADHRDPGDRLGVGGGGQQAEEAALAGHIALGVELLDADVVQVGRAVHGGAAVGLGQHQQLALAGLGPGRRGEPAEGGRGHGVLGEGVGARVGAEHAEAGAGDRLQQVLAVLGLDQVVLAVAEEGEVVVGQPAEQLLCLVHLLGRELGRRRAVQVVGQPQRTVAHLGPVLDHLADVHQHPAQVGLDGGQLLGVGLAVDLDVHPGLEQGVLGLVGAAGVGVQDLQQPTGDVAADQELRVDHHLDGAAQAGELVGDRVHQEGHVVGDHLDHGVAAGPAVLLHRRGVHPNLRGALGALLREPVVGGRRAVHIGRIAVEQVLGGCVQVVVLQVGAEGAVAELLTLSCLAEQFGLRCVQLGLHGYLAPVARRCVTRWCSSDARSAETVRILPHVRLQTRTNRLIPCNNEVSKRA